MIKIVVRLLFEQSGTFKNVFKEMGFEAFDYDIDNQFEETDFIVDLFNEINNAHIGKQSIFDLFSKEDLIIAFFPCTYFSVQNNLIFNGTCYNFKNWDDKKIKEYQDNRIENRKLFFEVLNKFVDVVEIKKIKTIIENPYTGNYLLTTKRFKNPQIIIKNRREYGDYYKKPTMFYFYNFEPTYFTNYTINTNKEKLLVNDNKGIKRSLISKEFAINFINKYIFGL